MAGQVVFPRPGGVVGGKYVLEAMLDSSAAGAVFRARHSTTGRPFAIRWLMRTSRAGASSHSALRDCAHVAESYQNPFVLSPVDAGRTPHGSYIVMEWLNGETLSSRMACDGALPLRAAAKILLPCMHALHDMHLAHAVHGDLRPGNIFICRGLEQHIETVRVFDYSSVGGSNLSARVDADGVYSRDAHFLAPEQLTNSTVDARTDVYAFGVLLYACVTGQLPFTPERSDDFARWVYGQDPPALPGAPGLTPALYKLLARAMARDAGERVASCLELADAVEELARQSEQTLVSIQPTKVIRSARPTIRMASEVPLPLPAAPDSLRAAVARMPVISFASEVEQTAVTTRVTPISLPPMAANDNDSVGGARTGLLPAPLAAADAPASLQRMPRRASRSIVPPTAASAPEPGRPAGPRATLLSSPPPAASSAAPSGPRATLLSSPPPAASSLRSGGPRLTPRSSPPQAPPAAGSQVPLELRNTVPTPLQPSWPLPAAKMGSSPAPSLRFSPSLRATADAAPARPSSAPPRRSKSPSTFESTIPLEVLRQEEYRKPLNRGLLVGSACLLVFGIAPTVAYFTPPVKEHEARHSAASTQPAPSLPEPIPPAREEATPTPASAPVLSIPNPHIDLDVVGPEKPANANTAHLVDDPSTPIDESDPLIAAALAAQEKAEAPSNQEQAAPAEKPQAEAPKPKLKTSNAPAKSVAAPTIAQPPTSAPRPVAPRSAASSSWNAEPYKTMPAKRLPWETPSPRKR